MVVVGVVSRAQERERLELLGVVGMIVGMILGASITMGGGRSRGQGLPRALSSDEPDRPEEARG